MLSWLWAIFSRRVYSVAIEYRGELAAAAHLATTPEHFKVSARTAAGARRAAIRDWCDKYQSPPRLITRTTVSWHRPPCRHYRRRQAVT